MIKLAHINYIFLWLYDWLKDSNYANTVLLNMKKKTCFHRIIVFGSENIFFFLLLVFCI